MYQLMDTFNRVCISKHRTVHAAVLASRKHDRGVRRHNGSASYIPKVILENGKPLSIHDEAERERLEFLIRG